MLGELYTWAYRRANPDQLLAILQNEFLAQLIVLDFDQPCAHRFGQLRGQMLGHGAVVNSIDLMIASVALVHDLTFVTHNTKHFEPVPGLRLVDWLAT